MSTYIHPNAGTVYIVQGLILQGDWIAGREKIHLYRAAGEIHQLRSDTPQGVVSIEPYHHLVCGWGFNGLLVKVTKDNGSEIIVKKSAIDNIE